MTRRLTTRTFAHRAASYLDNSAQFVAALNLPMLPEILDTMDEHAAARFFILAPYQTAKSLAGQLRLLRSAYVDPERALWYGPSDDFVKEFADTKLNTLWDAIPCLRLVQHPDRNKRAKLRIAGAGGFSLLLLSANTENDRHGKTARDIYMDEVHRYEHGWIGQIRNRRGAYTESADWRELMMSTGLDVGTEAAQEWCATDQRTWHCRCPKCSELFQPLFLHRDEGSKEIVGGLRYERVLLKSGMPNEAEIAKTLAYECPHCHARFPDTGGTRTLFSGTADKPTGKYVAMNPTAAPKCFGWNFHAIAVRPWLPIVMRFERAQAARKAGDLEPLANCIREEFAALWNPEPHLREEKLRPTGNYQMGDAWADEAVDPEKRPVRAATVDVQQDHFVLVIRSWSMSGASRLRWAEKVTTPSRINDLCREHGVIPQRVYLDARHEPDYVKRVAAQFGWRVLLGEKDKDYFHSSTGLRRIFSEPRMVDAFAGTNAKGVVAQFMFSKQSALSRLHLLRTMPGSDGNPLWSSAQNAPDWYWKEIDAHYRKKEKAVDGQESYTWHGWKEDHAGDCEAMQIVFASMAGLVGSESLETAAASKS